MSPTVVLCLLQWLCLLPSAPVLYSQPLGSVARRTIFARPGLNSGVSSHSPGANYHFHSFVTWSSCRFAYCRWKPSNSNPIYIHYTHHLKSWTKWIFNGRDLKESECLDVKPIGSLTFCLEFVLTSLKIHPSANYSTGVVRSFALVVWRISR